MKQIPKKVVPVKESTNNLAEEKLKEILIQEPKTEDEKKENVEKEGANEVELPDVQELVDYNVSKHQENEDILSMFPFIGSAYKIIRATTINSIPNYTNNLPLPPETMFELSNMIKESIEERFELHKTIHKTQEDALFRNGAVAYISIPYKSYKGILDTTTKFTRNKVGAESDNALKEILTDTMGNQVLTGKEEGLKLEFTSGLNAFDIGQTLVKKTINETNFKVSGEDEDVLDIMNMFTDIVDPTKESTIFIKDNEKSDVEQDGYHSLINADFCIPLILNGTLDKPIGFIYMLDDKLSPIDADLGVYTVDGIEYNEEGASSSDLKQYLEKARDKKGSNKSPNLELSDFDLYTELFNKHIEDVIDKSALSGMVKTPDMQNIMAVMFRRALKAKATKMIYLPASIVTYYAFNYRSNGTGKSLIEDVRELVHMLAALTFAKMRSEVENNISKRVVNVKIDPKNKNPTAFMAQFIAEYTMSHRKGFKWGTKSIRETADMISRSGFNFIFDHPKVPYNEVTEDNQTMGTGATVSDDFMQTIKTDILRRFGLTKQMVDDSADVNFATLSVLSNELSKNEMSVIQEQLMHHYTIHVRQVLNVDATFNKELLELVTKDKAKIIKSLGDRFKKRLEATGKSEEHKVAFIMHYIKSNFVASLPSLQNEDENSLKTRFESYVRNVEDTVDKMLFTDESMPAEFAGEEFSGIADAFKRSYKNMLIRKWLIDNNYMTEVADIISVTDGVINIDHLTEYVGNLQALAKALKPYAGLFKKVRKNLDKATTNLLGDVAPEPEPTPTATEEPPAEPVNDTPPEPTEEPIEEPSTEPEPTEEPTVSEKEPEDIEDTTINKEMNKLLDS